MDHNTLQVGFENAEDHIFLQTFSAKYGLHFSRAGNGICHPVHLERVDPSFVERIKELGGGFVVAGNNDGQESSREHAALAPMFLGVKAVIAKSFARIHLANLINFGVLPLPFKEETDYPKVDQGDELEIEVGDLKMTEVTLFNKTKKIEIPLLVPLNERKREIIKAGGTLGFVKEQRSKK
jgi:aconitate hydratase